MTPYVLPPNELGNYGSEFPPPASASVELSYALASPISDDDLPEGEEDLKEFAVCYST